jgi:hypothetical protein
MGAEKHSKFVAGPLKIFTTLLMLLFAVVFVQTLVTQIAFVWTYRLRYIRPTQPEGPNWRIARSAKHFLPDGTIHLIYRSDHSRAGEDYEQEQTYDANDNLLWQGLRKDRPYEYLSWGGSRATLTKRRINEMRMISAEFSRELEIPVNSKEKTEQVWRYQSRGGVFIGYDMKGGRIGYISAAGFTESKSGIQPLGTLEFATAWVPPDSFSPTVLWQTKTRVYQINFEERRVDLILDASEEKIRWIRLHSWGITEPELRGPNISIKYRPLIDCLTEDNKHHLILREPDERVTVDVPADWDRDSVAITATQEKILLQHTGTDSRPPEGISRGSAAWHKWWRRHLSRPHHRWVGLYTLENRTDLHRLNRFDWTVPAQPSLAEIEPSDIYSRIKKFTNQLSPPAYSLVWRMFGEQLWAISRRSSGMIHAYEEIISSSMSESTVTNLLVSAVMVILALRHAWPRRTSRAKVIFWLIFVAFFNLAGLLTYLALSHTPVIKCPLCGKRRGLECLDCVRCGAELPRPEPTGHDLIFDTSLSAQEPKT